MGQNSRHPLDLIYSMASLVACVLAKALLGPKPSTTVLPCIIILHFVSSPGCGSFGSYLKEIIIIICKRWYTGIQRNQRGQRHEYHAKSHESGYQVDHRDRHAYQGRIEGVVRRWL